MFRRAKQFRHTHLSLASSLVLLACAGLLLPSRAAAGIPSASNSTIPCGITLVGSSGGVVDVRGEFTITVRDEAGNPIPGSRIEIDFDACTPDILVCSAQPHMGDPADCGPPVGEIRAVTDGSGTAVLRIMGSANNYGGAPGAGFKCATVYADGVNLGNINVAAYDQNANGGVGPSDMTRVQADIASGVYVGRSDFNCSHTINAADLSAMQSAINAGGSSQSCPVHCFPPVPTFPIDFDVTAIPNTFFSVGAGCLESNIVQTVYLEAGPHTLQSCVVNCSGGFNGIAFEVDGTGNVTYDPELEGVVNGAGTNQLVVNSYNFPPVGDDRTQSMGLFRVVVEPAFWTLMNGYPGYQVVKWVHRLISPGLYDPATIIGRSDVHRDGSTADISGTPVGTAGTIISDQDFAQSPPGFQGPAGTLELHTEIRSLNMRGNIAGGQVAVRAGVHAPSHPMSAISPGEIEAGPGVTGLFPAESFFDVFVEVDMPILGTLYNTEPLIVENSGIVCFPPTVVYRHRHTGPVPIAFKADDTMLPKRWLKDQRFGWLVLAGHGLNFDTLSTTASIGQRGAGILSDPFAAFRDSIDSEPEMQNTETIVVDVRDVVTFASPSAFVQPQYRDSLVNGIAAAAALGQSGDPCAGTHLAIQLYQRVDKLSQPQDWVVDTTIARVLAERIHALGAQLQAQANQSGGCLPTDVPDGGIPANVAIVSIQPNPSFSTATIEYAIPTQGRVTMSVFDLSGRLVRNVVDAELPAGRHRAVWDGHRDRTGGRVVTSGTYFVRLSFGGVTQMKKVVMLR